MELTSSAVERTANQAHQAVDAAATKANEKIPPAIDRIADAAHRTVDRAAQAAGPAAEWLNESAAQMRQQQQQLVHECRRTIRERPLMAVVVALVAGYCVGRLVR